MFFYFLNIKKSGYILFKLIKGVIMIDWAFTLKKYGYEEKDLAKTSKKVVIWQCDNPDCDAPMQVNQREYEYNYIRKKEEAAKKANKPCLCQKCCHAHRKGKVSEKKQDTALPLPPETNVEKTIERFGYNPHDLSPWSRKRIVLTYISEDGTEYESEAPRAQLNKYESVKKFGHFIPIAIYTKKRRTGEKASEETKRQMREAQQHRRQRDRDKKKEETETNKENSA